jgi:hypothetical protein
MFALAGSLVCASALPAVAAQVIIQPPYSALNTVVYDVDYAVSTGQDTATAFPADTIVSIGLPASFKSGLCQAQVAWFDWDGTAAGLSGPGTDPKTGAPYTLAPGETLEFSTSFNAAPNNYPDFQENVFRNSSATFEGYAQVRVQCDSATTAQALRVDAEFATRQPGPVANGPPVVTTKTINVTAPTGLLGY